MADGTIQLPAEGTGKKLDTEQLTVGANTVQRERFEISGAAAAEIARVLNTDPTGSEYAIIARLLETNSAQFTHATQATVAAGSSADLDGAQITSSKTGKLLGFDVAASVPFKVVLVTVLNGVESANKSVLFSGGDRNVMWRTPGRQFITVAQNAGAGLDAFRLKVTNLDTSQAADLYASLYWDES